MTRITTHVLDTSQGRPATGVGVKLSRLDQAGEATQCAQATTNADGRVTEWSDSVAIEMGTYRLDFDTAGYFGETPAFYPSVTITFRVTSATEHYHVPLLISAFGYSTYRGS